MHARPIVQSVELMLAVESFPVLKAIRGATTLQRPRATLASVIPALPNNPEMQGGEVWRRPRAALVFALVARHVRVEDSQRRDARLRVG